MKCFLFKSTLLFSLFLLLIASCNNNINQLQNEVLKDIEAKIENQGQDIQVKSFVLTHVSGNEYTGVLETFESGQLYTYNVNVVSDGNSFVWEIPSSEMNTNETEAQTNRNDNYSDNSYEENGHENMVDAMENISDPTYCSLCKGSGVQRNTAKDIFGGPDETTCQMCKGTGRLSY